jgi:hypothetical protein
MQLTA